MNYYTKSEIADLIEQRQNMILVPENYHHHIRLELKWAHVGLLNLLLNEPKFDEQQNGYLEENKPLMMNMLHTLMNKKVDEEKLAKYLQELQEEDLLDIVDNKYYLKK